MNVNNESNILTEQLELLEPIFNRLDNSIATRRSTYNTRIGDVNIGSQHPIVVQSMTDTNTEDIEATVAQIVALANAGSEMVRITINSVQAGKNVSEIKQRLIDLGYSNVPIIGDFHFNGHKILAATNCGAFLDKYRINPGNVGFGKNKNNHFEYIVKTAIDNNKPIRIGGNWGSLDQELLTKLMNKNQTLQKPLSSNTITRLAMMRSVLSSAELAEQIGIKANMIILSCKVSLAQDLIAIYQELAKHCKYPLHLGLTEAGMGDYAIVSSSAAISHLLINGIGDTIRISLTPKPGADRTKEVEIAKNILQAIGVRNFSPTITSCPGCGRTSSNYFQYLASDIQDYIKLNMPIWSHKYQGIEDLKIAVMGCVVNGPGESKMANIGISLPGRDEYPCAPVFIDGIKTVTLKGNDITEQFKQIILEYIDNKYTQY